MIQKVFDTINYEILLKKLEAIGFSDLCVQLFRLCLCEQIHFIEIENQLSDYGKLSCGVPEGYILGPLMFLIYVNDVAHVSGCKLKPLFICRWLVSCTNIEMPKKLKIFCDWLVDNKLSIHFGESKTKSILFASEREIKSARKVNVKFKNIKQHSQVTYLCCVLDETLPWEPMALKALNKVNGKLKFVYRKNKYLTPTLRRMLCNAIIRPYFGHDCSAWYPNFNEITNHTL